MSQLARIVDIAKFEGQEVTIRGWLHNRRSSAKIHFLTLRDGSGFIQAVVKKDSVSSEDFLAIGNMGQETSLTVTGKVGADTRAHGGFEIDVSSIKLVGTSLDYPIAPKEHGVDYLLDRRHLWIRGQRQAAILRVRHEIMSAARNFLEQEGFIGVDAPILQPTTIEGASSAFSTQYFKEGEAYLALSGRFYNEAAAMALGKVYSLGPRFKGTRSKTRRHLAETWMVEPEVAFATLDNIMQLSEDLILAILHRVIEKRLPELKVLERDVNKLGAIGRRFPCLSYRQAVRVLHSKEQPFEEGSDFSGTDETILSMEHEAPILLHRCPSKIKSFSTKSDPTHPGLALSLDVLAPEGYGEIISGGQRVDDLGELEARMRERHIGVPEWYVDLRRYGSVPHAGFSMNIERVVGWICGLEHVRESIPFPRMMFRIYP